MGIVFALVMGALCGPAAVNSRLRIRPVAVALRVTPTAGSRVAAARNLWPF